MRAGKTSKSDNLFGGGSDSEGDLFDSDEDSSAPTSTSGTGASGGLFGSSAASSSTGGGGDDDDLFGSDSSDDDSSAAPPPATAAKAAKGAKAKPAAAPKPAAGAGLFGESSSESSDGTHQRPIPPLKSRLLGSGSAPRCLTSLAADKSRLETLQT